MAAVGKEVAGLPDARPEAAGPLVADVVRVTARLGRLAVPAGLPRSRERATPARVGIAVEARGSVAVVGLPATARVSLAHGRGADRLGGGRGDAHQAWLTAVQYVDIKADLTHRRALEDVEGAARLTIHLLTHQPLVTVVVAVPRELKLAPRVLARLSERPFTVEELAPPRAGVDLEVSLGGGEPVVVPATGLEVGEAVLEAHLIHRRAVLRRLTPGFSGASMSEVLAGLIAGSLARTAQVQLAPRDVVPDQGVDLGHHGPRSTPDQPGERDAPRPESHRYTLAVFGVMGQRKTTANRVGGELLSGPGGASRSLSAARQVTVPHQTRRG